MTNTTISIIMPSYNSELYIKQAIQSAISQLDVADELVIQDGGSSDNTLSLITEMSAEDSRIKIESAPDKGQSDALNKALQRSRSEYIMWLNSDDILVPGALEALRREIESAPTPPDMVFGGHAITRADGSVIAEYRPQTLDRRQLILKGCYVFSGSIAVSRLRLIEAGAFSSQYDYCMDLDLFFRLVDSTAGNVLRVPHIVGTLRWHDASKSGSDAWKFVIDGLRVRRVHATSPLERGMSIVAALRQSIAIATTPIRHSPLYTRVRGRVRS